MDRHLLKILVLLCSLSGGAVTTQAQSGYVQQLQQQLVDVKQQIARLKMREAMGSLDEAQEVQLEELEQKKAQLEKQLGDVAK